jgi:hypothetical protein
VKETEERGQRRGNRGRQSEDKKRLSEILRCYKVRLLERKIEKG